MVPRMMLPSPGDAKNAGMACAAHTCVATALVRVVVKRAGDDGCGDVGAAEKVESRACDFGGVGVLAVVERVCCDARRVRTGARQGVCIAMNVRFRCERMARQSRRKKANLEFVVLAGLEPRSWVPSRGAI